MILYTRLKCWWHARKDGRRNYPAVDDSVCPEFEGELHRACQQGLSTLAINWHEREKETEARFANASRACENTSRELDKAKQDRSSSEVALNQAEKLSQNLEHVSPGHATYLVLMGFLMLLELPLNSAVFEVFGRSTVETWIYALVPSAFIPILAHFIGQSLKRGLSHKTPLAMFLISTALLAGLFFVQAYVREKYFTGSGYQQVVGFTLNSRMVTLVFLFLTGVVAMASVWLSYNASPSDPGTFNKIRKMLNKAKRANRDSAKRMADTEKKYLIASAVLEKTKAERKHAFGKTLNEAERLKNIWANYVYYYRHIHMQNRKDNARPSCFNKEPQVELPDGLKAIEWHERTITTGARAEAGNFPARAVTLAGRR
ncbi:MAG: hypothetical protein M0Z52_12285 [Actinomycetota bacterium]|nr:hypothetical protein [Nitrospiraceae bacterium]MDA8157207.1 hypothetical protein [Actinomycetota bacterium]